MNIFVSSVGGLKHERQALIRQIADIGDRAIAMEHFGANPTPPLEECFAQLDEADFMVLVLGPSYGCIHDGTGLSYTENEFRYARKRKIPVLAFRIKNLDEAITSENSPESARKYSEFVEFVSSSVTYASEPFETSDQLARLVVTAIHNHKQAQGELGRRMSPFVTWREYFGPLLNSQQYLNHSWPLVGRAEVLAGLRDFAAGERSVAVLYGAGGSGKSRLLVEFASTFDEQLAGWDLRFLRETLPWSGDSPRALPAHPCLIVVDDAHRFAELESLLTLLRSDQYVSRTKLLLTARTSGKEAVSSALTRSVDASMVKEIGTLQPMGTQDVRRLATDVLGPECAHYAERLVKVSDGCPLVTVVGGRLVRDGFVIPELFTTEEEFRRAVLDRFADELTKALPGDNGSWRQLLALVAALGPIRPGELQFRQRAGDLLKSEPLEFVQRVATLEEHGLLLRRGGLARITPDVLGDHLLHVACVTPSGDETAYAASVFTAFGSSYGANLLRNLAEMQWRIDVTHGKPDVLGSIWEAVNRDFDSADYAGKVKILKTIEKAAAYQPRAALQLVQKAISKEAGATRKADAGIFDFSGRDVIEALPAVLRQTALSPDYAAMSMNLLWKLGRSDARELNPHPDHAVRVLRDLASYEYRKPIYYCEKVLACAEEWAKDPALPTYRYSVLDVTDQLLEKQVSYQEAEGHQIKLAALPLQP
jgi:hypothetical protein